MNEYYENDEFNEEIDPEMWLNVVMYHMADKQEKQKLIEGISDRTGLAVEKVEEMFHSLAEILIEVTRSN